MKQIYKLITDYRFGYEEETYLQLTDDTSDIRRCFMVEGSTDEIIRMCDLLHCESITRLG